MQKSGPMGIHSNGARNIHEKRRNRRPSEEGRGADDAHRRHPENDTSDSLGADGELPEGGASTRGMSSGPASKSPLPTGSFGAGDELDPEKLAG